MNLLVAKRLAVVFKRRLRKHLIRSLEKIAILVQASKRLKSLILTTNPLIKILTLMLNRKQNKLRRNKKHPKKAVFGSERMAGV